METPCPRCGRAAEVYEGPQAHKQGTVFCDNCHARIPLPTPVEEPEPQETEAPASADETAAAEEPEGEIAEQDDPSPRGRRHHN